MPSPPSFRTLNAWWLCPASLPCGFGLFLAAITEFLSFLPHFEWCQTPTQGSWLETGCSCEHSGMMTPH